MKFPVEHCFKCKELPKTKFNKLLTKLFSDGYNMTAWEIEEYHQEWEYCGVNSYGSVVFYSENQSYIDVDTEPFYNVLSEEWLNNYLEDM